MRRLTKTLDTESARDASLTCFRVRQTAMFARCRQHQSLGGVASSDKQLITRRHLNCVAWQILIIYRQLKTITASSISYTAAAAAAAAEDDNDDEVATTAVM